MSSVYFPAADFRPTEDMSALTAYRWGDHEIDHIFCKTCGIYPYHGDEAMGFRVNLGCVDGLDVLSLEIGIIDGRAM
jgi:hypothetical protein